MDMILPMTDRQGQALYSDLVLQFLADLMNATQEARTPEAFQRALQEYCDALRPWLVQTDAPAAPRPVFPLFDACTINEEEDEAAVLLSLEGEAFFRAWVRRQAVLSDAACRMDPGWSH
jgi:hypothetical protein